jgi:hypothetical protein
LFGVLIFGAVIVQLILLLQLIKDVQEVLYNTPPSVEPEKESGVTVISSDRTETVVDLSGVDLPYERSLSDGYNETSEEREYENEVRYRERHLLNVGAVE